MQPEDIVGQMLGHYQIKRQIGSGGTATVYLAQDIHLSREIVLKVFWPKPGETQDFLRRFLREARVLAQLDHPHILTVYDYGEEGNRAFLVTPYMSGGSLKEILQERKVLPPSESIQLIRQVLPALQYAHDRGLIHRDIKPGNLLFKGDGNLVLADFGLVKVTANDGQKEPSPLHTLTSTRQSIVGTPEYMAPEQIESRVVAASDIYAMGVVLYEMTTGVRPFTGESLLNVLMKHIQERPRPPHEINPYISPQLEAVILRSLEKDPHKRFARPIDFQQALIQSTVRVGNPASRAGIVEGVSATSGSPPPIQSLPTTAMQPIALNDEQTPLVLLSQAVPGSASSTFQSKQSWMPPPTVPAALTPIPTQPVKPNRLPMLVLIILLLAGLVASLFLTPVGTLLGLHGPGAFIPGKRTPTATTGTPITRFGTTPTPPNTQSVSGASTACPAVGTARSATLAPLTMGPDATIVSIANEHDANGPTVGTLSAYDIITGQKTILVQMSRTVIDEAQIANDGQWILFVATVGGQSELRLVRLDGQGLQSLLCAPTGVAIKDSQWSIDQTHVIFDEVPPAGEPTVYLLDTLTGSLQAEVIAPDSGAAVFARTWLDNNRVLMVSMLPGANALPQSLYLLNINQGANQSLSNLPVLFTPSQLIWDFDTSYDGNTLFITQSLPAQPHGSSTIATQPVSGLSSTSILISSTLAFGIVRVINAQSSYLLAIASDATQSNPAGDPQQDGLYLINTEKSATQHLVSTSSGLSMNLNLYSQYFWSNISRDGNMYALETQDISTHDSVLSYGLLSGGTPTVFVNTPGVAATIVGWTTNG
jgi:eukaryotic-like serine/threonine-protein kinase